MQTIDDIITTAEVVEVAKQSRHTPQVTCASRRRPMDTSEYAQAHGTLYRLYPRTSKRSRKQERRAA